MRNPKGYYLKKLPLLEEGPFSWGNACIGAWREPLVLLEMHALCMV